MEARTEKDTAYRSVLNLVERAAQIMARTRHAEPELNRNMVAIQDEDGQLCVCVSAKKCLELRKRLLVLREGWMVANMS